jgi:integrase/recombinase XerD
MTLLADATDDFLADVGRRRNWRPATIDAYRCDLTVAARQLTMPLTAITEADLDLVLHDAQVALTTRHRRCASLKQFFTWAMRQQLCLTNPLTYYELPQLDERLPRPIRTQQERKAIDAAIAAAPAPYKLIFTLLRETGLRANEVLQLNIGDVHLEAGRESLLIRAPKNRRDRVHVLGPTSTPKSLRALRSYLKALGSPATHEPLFRSNRHTRVTYDALHYQWRKLCLAAKLLDERGEPRYTVHQLRHTRGTELVDEGHALHIIQRALGHKDPRSTQIYADVTEDHVRQALETRR